MKTRLMFALIANRGRTVFNGRCIFLAAAVFGLAQIAARAADPGPSASSGKIRSVTLESIPESAAKRVILTEKAFERLGIETGKVGEAAIVRTQVVGGLVIPPMEKKPETKSAGGTFGGFGSTAATEVQPIAARAALDTVGEVWVQVTLSPVEWDRLAKDKPARVLPLATRDPLTNEILAPPAGIAPIEDVKRSMLSVFYMVPGKDHGLTVNRRMRVELQLSGNDEKQKVVPYGAVYYDGQGSAWVYVNAKPFAFERQRVRVERIAGDLAVLSEGPAVGTSVVTVGAPLLYGAEIFGK